MMKKRGVISVATLLVFFSVFAVARADVVVGGQCLWGSAPNCSLGQTPPSSPSDASDAYNAGYNYCEQNKTAAGVTDATCTLLGSKVYAAVSAYTTCIAQSGATEAQCDQLAENAGNNQTTPIDPATGNPASAPAGSTSSANTPPANGTPITTGSGSTPTPTGNTSNSPGNGTSGTGPVAVPTSATTNTSATNLTYTPLEPLPGINPQEENGAPQNIVPLLSGLLMLAIILGGMLAVARFSIGGVIFITSDVVGNRVKAKSQMWASVWGLLLLICSALILRTINPNLINFNFASDLAQLGGTSTGSNPGAGVIPNCNPTTTNCSSTGL